MPATFITYLVREGRNVGLSLFKGDNNREIFKAMVACIHKIIKYITFALFQYITFAMFHEIRKVTPTLYYSIINQPCSQPTLRQAEPGEL